MALETQVQYRYFLTDLLTNQIISEVPFKGVSYERVNRRAGTFEGTIPFVEATRGLNLYESTMPGRTGIYVLRNNVCVWGGIIWSRSYDGLSQELSVSGGEFMSYFYHRQIWQTIQYGSNYVGVSSYSVVAGEAVITTEIPHGFFVGQRIAISFTSPVVDGIHTITSIPSATQYTFDTRSADESGTSTSGACRSLVDSYDLARDLVSQIATDLGGLDFANEFIKPAKEFEVGVIQKSRSANIVTLRTSVDHGIIAGQEVEVLEVGSDIDGIHVVSEVPDSRTFKYELVGADLPLESDSAQQETNNSLPGIRILNVIAKQLTNNVAFITLDGDHGASPGDTVFLAGVDGFFTGILDTKFNGRFTITSTPTPRAFTYTTGGILDIPSSEVAGGLAAFGSRVIYGDYGSYVANGDIGIEFENTEKSGFYQETQVFRGFEQKTVGEILEQYSNVVDGGFEYRIDCDYDETTSTFSRTFKLFPIDLAEPPPPGDVYPVTAFGAETVVFEYPGNITKFSVEESAEDAATRFFVVGKTEDLTDAASQPYAGAAERALLSNPNGRSWPLIDQVEQVEELSDELSLYDYAKDFLFEARPPMGTVSIDVNGSLSPEVGTYFPGDWCSIIIDDDFLRQRLESDQEPRDDLLIRKIESYKVSVPDTNGFAEEVSLTLVTDWKVDQSG